MQKFDLTPFLLRLSLEPLIDAAEKVLPTQAENWRGWKNWHGINSQYRAWRGALGVSVSGDVLTVQAHIRYWTKARKKLLGAIKLKGSCGRCKFTWPIKASGWMVLPVVAPGSC